MNQESLEAHDETVEPKRESGIFADLAVRQTSEPPRAEGRSIPPPPPTRSSILPVAKRPDEDAGMELEGFGGDEESEPEELLDDDDDEIKPVQVHAPSSLIRPDVASVSSSRTLPPPPPRASSPSLPGTSFPSAQASARSTSIAPGTRPVSPMVANAAVAYPETQPVAATQPIERDMSGTYQKVVEPPRPSYAAALQGPMAMPAAQVALDHVEPAYGAAPTAPASRQIPYAMLVVGALIAGCFAWYMFAARTVPGVVQLTTAPADATVLFDGMPVGSVSPFLKTGVVPGVKHTLEVKKPGFRTWAQEVEVQSGQTLIFTVALPSEAGETNALPSAPAAPVAAAPLPAPVAAPVAEVAAPAVPVSAVAANVEAPAPPAAPAQTPAPKAAARRASAPAAASGATGTLRVSSRPWAIVTIDGKLIGNTPQMNLTLPEGSHRVQLNNPEFNVEKVVTVKIQAGKTETLIINLL